MTTEEILIYRREDLHKSFEKLPIEQINCMHMLGPTRVYHTHPIVMFIDDGGQSKILKNRYGNDGMIK